MECVRVRHWQSLRWCGDGFGSFLHRAIESILVRSVRGTATFVAVELDAKCGESILCCEQVVRIPVPRLDRAEGFAECLTQGIYAFCGRQAIPASRSVGLPSFWPGLPRATADV